MADLTAGLWGFGGLAKGISGGMMQSMQMKQMDAKLKMAQEEINRAKKIDAIQQALKAQQEKRVQQQMEEQQKRYDQEQEAIEQLSPEIAKHRRAGFTSIPHGMFEKAGLVPTMTKPKPTLAPGQKENLLTNLMGMVQQMDAQKAAWDNYQRQLTAAQEGGNMEGIMQLVSMGEGLTPPPENYDEIRDAYVVRIKEINPQIANAFRKREIAGPPPPLPVPETSQPQSPSLWNRAGNFFGNFPLLDPDWGKGQRTPASVTQSIPQKTPTSPQKPALPKAEAIKRLQTLTGTLQKNKTPPDKGRIALEALAHSLGWTLADLGY